MTPHKKENYSSVQFFPCLMLSWHALIIFRIYVIEKSWILFLKMVKIFKDDENFFGEHDFSIQSSYTGQV